MYMINWLIKNKLNNYFFTWIDLTIFMCKKWFWNSLSYQRLKFATNKLANSEVMKHVSFFLTLILVRYGKEVSFMWKSLLVDNKLLFLFRFFGLEISLLQEVNNY